MTDTERQFWIAVRAALLAIVAAIERYAELGKYAKPVIIPLQNSQNEDISLEQK